MSHHVQALVWLAEIPNPQAKLVAVKLADHANDGGGSIFPSVETVAHATSLSRSTVCKWQAAFEHCGLLMVAKRVLGGEGNTTARAFNLDMLKRVAWTKSGKGADFSRVQAFGGDDEHEVVDRKTGKPKKVRVTVFEIVPFRTTARDTYGSSNGNRPADGRTTVRQTDFEPSAPRTETIRNAPKGNLPPSPRGGRRPFQRYLDPSISGPRCGEGRGDRGRRDEALPGSVQSRHRRSNRGDDRERVRRVVD